MRVLTESDGGIGLCNHLAAVGDNGEAVLVLALLDDSDGLHPLDLADGAGNGPFAVGAFDAVQPGGVGDLGSEDLSGKQESEEDERGNEGLHGGRGNINASFMHKTVAFSLHYGRRVSKRKLIANNQNRK